MKTTRRTIAVGAVVAMSLSALAGCSNNNNNDNNDNTTPSSAATTESQAPALGQGEMANWAVGGTFKATEPLDISLMYRDHSNYPYKDSWLIISQLASQQNITFDKTTIPLSDWGSQKPIVIGSGDVPDLIPVTYTSEQSTYASGGAILPISDYLSQMPNFQDKISKWNLQPEIDTLKQANGKFYVLPGIHQNVRFQYTIAINDTMWQKAGITTDPKTWDEFATDLQKVKDANGLQYAISDRWKMGSILAQAAPNFGTIGGTVDASNTWGFGNGVFYNGTNFEYAGAMDEQKAMLAYFADLTAKGLLDPDSLGQDDAPAIAKFTSRQTAAISSNDQTIATDLRNTMMGDGNNDTVRLIRVPDGPAGGWVNANHMESGLMVANAAKDKPYFNALLQYIDWMYYSDSGLEFGKWGVQCPSGVTDSTVCTFTKAADGTRTLLPDIRLNGINQEGDGTTQKQLNADYGFSNGVFMLANGSTADLEQSMFSDDATFLVDAMADKQTMPQALAPAAPLSEDDSTDAGIIQTQLTNIMVQDTVAYILGQKDINSDWDNHVQALKDAGMDQYIQYYNEAAGLA